MEKSHYSHATGFVDRPEPDIFVVIERHRFKEVVQKLTSGVSHDSNPPPTIPPSRNSKKGRERLRSDWTEHEVGVQKSGFKLHDRRKIQKKLEIKAGLTHPTGINNALSPMTLPALISSSPADPSRNYSDPTSCDNSSYLEEEGEEKKFCFQELAFSAQREPELLPLFPLHSWIQPNHNA